MYDFTLFKILQYILIMLHITYILVYFDEQNKTKVKITIILNKK